mgnify:CR=1 FL=1
MSDESTISVVPLTKDRWEDFKTLMGPKGGCGGCWCMLWRQTKTDFEKNTGDGNLNKMKTLVAGNALPGLLAYSEEQPIGWISVAPRENYVRLEKSRVLKPLDDQPGWSVSCFMIDKSYRRQGIAAVMLKVACDFVQEQGGIIIEGYPIAPKKDPYPAVYAWTGFESVFKRAGFSEVARRSETRPIMRKILKPA